MKVNFQALGCRLNEAELESWSQQFTRYGHQLTLDSSDADLVVFNSCSVTAQADRKSRQLINRIKRANPAGRLVVTGCYASLNPDSVKQQLGVDLVVDNQNKDELPSTVLDHFGEELSEVAAIDDECSVFGRGRHRAFIKVQDGCRYRCTFCIVTVARGEERSRQLQDIIDEINHHHQHGVQEIVLTGVHVGGYGSDLGSNLYHLLLEILEKTDIPRIRLASVEPWDLPLNFFELFKNERLMPHIHLPLQSGSDTVLRRMARRCKTAEFREVVARARDAVPLFNITTDIIVGFPGESDSEWRESVEFVESIEFGDIHVFSYSPREGTKAARLPERVAADIQKARSQELIALARASKSRALQRHVGSQLSVLWENRIQENGSIWNGYTPYYHKVWSRPREQALGAPEQVQIGAVDSDALVLRQFDPLEIAV